MITIIHGEDIASSRKYFLEQKMPDAITFAGEKLTVTELLQVFEGGGLFGDEKKVFIEDFFSKRKPSHEFDDIINYLKKNESQSTVIFWEGKELSKKNLSFFAKATIKSFAFPKTIFSFLDNVRPGNAKNLIVSFHKTLETTEAELILFLLVRQFRLLLAISDTDAKDTIDEAKRLAPWQKSNLQRQAHYFTQKQLLFAYQKLKDIDIGSKTGGLTVSVTQAIDFFLLAL